MKNVMSIDSKKLVLIEWISRINDFAVIDKLIEIKEKEIDSDNFLISRNEQNSIDLGIEDANNGKLTAHSEVKKIYEKWL